MINKSWFYRGPSINSRRNRLRRRWHRLLVFLHLRRRPVQMEVRIYDE